MERSKGYVSRPKKKTRKEELWRTKTETECSTQKYFKLNPTYPIQERKSSFSSWQIGTVNKSIHEGICKLIKLLKEFHERFTHFFFFIDSPHLAVKLKQCHFLINSLKSITRLSFFLVFLAWSCFNHFKKERFPGEMKRLTVLYWIWWPQLGLHNVSHRSCSFIPRSLIWISAKFLVVLFNNAS